jgi:hypothetical protein
VKTKFFEAKGIHGNDSKKSERRKDSEDIRTGAREQGEEA